MYKNAKKSICRIAFVALMLTATFGYVSPNGRDGITDSKRRHTTRMHRSMVPLQYVDMSEEREWGKFEKS